MRPLVQYDLDDRDPLLLLSTQKHSSGPPAKKRKRNHRHPQKSQSIPSGETPLQHWDDPGSTAVCMRYDEQEDGEVTSASHCAGSLAASDTDEIEEGEEEEEYDEVEGDEVVDVDVSVAQEGNRYEEGEEESRELTHEEIWDDAALIDAWNSAEAEYKAYHGTSKTWKTEPVKKSPLWYNKPYTAPKPPPGPSKRKAYSKPPPPPQEDGEPEPNTAPLDFYTFVPTYDPSLSIPPDTGANPAKIAPSFASPMSTKMTSRDEAFHNALSAMYWSGYWTAMYHSQSSGQDGDATGEATEENEMETNEDEEDLVPAQR